MSIVSGYDSQKLMQSTNDGYKAISLWTSADTVEMENGDSVETTIGNIETNIDDIETEIDNLETVVDGKQPTITGAATTITEDDLTTSRALISNSSGKVAVSGITATELGYLDNATGNIQNQINGRFKTSDIDTSYASINPDWVKLEFISFGTLKIMMIQDNFYGNAPAGWSVLTSAGGIAEKYRPIKDISLTQTLPGGTRMTMSIRTTGAISMYLSQAVTTNDTTRVNFIYM